MTGPGSDDEGMKQRGARRLKSFIPVTLDQEAGTVRAHVLDMSETGALVHCEAAIRSGERLQLRVGHHVLRGGVMWVEGKRFGFRFTLPLTVTEVQAIVSASEAGR